MAPAYHKKEDASPLFVARKHSLHMTGGLIVAFGCGFGCGVWIVCVVGEKFVKN